MSHKKDKTSKEKQDTVMFLNAGNAAWETVKKVEQKSENNQKQNWKY